MGHIERAVLTVDDPKLIPRIYYDIRERGCLYETDINESRNLVIDVTNVFKVLYRDVDCIYDDEDEVIAYFKSLDMSTVGLHSAIGRDLGFSAHHAMHHLAMIKVIAMHLNIDHLLPDDFGKAPGTVEFLLQQ